MALRVLHVETAAVSVQYRANIANDPRVQALLKGVNVKIKAEEAPSDFEYEINDDQRLTRRVTITKYTGNAGTVDIPGQIQRKPVTTIR